jgi:NADPH-dependent 2,4-dienoyl-CoA reductase/sulfur reductase-like enzyme
LWSDNTIAVTLVDPNEAFISCPLSNLVLGGSRTMADITVGFSGLDKYGIKRVQDTVIGIDADKKQVRLGSGATLPFDRLVVSPGVEFMYDRLQGWTPAAEATVLHAWKVGPQTVALRKQLTDMADGGVVLMSIPVAPYRCPPGPYERACQIAWYLKQSKPKSKLIVLDGNPDMVSKKPLFTRVFGEDYKGIIDYRVGAPVAEIDVKGSTLVTEIGDRVKGDVINVIPPQRAANIARDGGLITANNRWCEVNWTSMESIKVPGIHVLGDATLSAPAMPKSGHMANQHGKAAAAAIIELLNGRAVVPPMMANTCYSFIDDKNAVHVDSVHRWVPEKKTLEPVAGSGGISSQDRASWALEGTYANGWAQTIWADMLT